MAAQDNTQSVNTVLPELELLSEHDIGNWEEGLKLHLTHTQNISMLITDAMIQAVPWKIQSWTFTHCFICESEELSPQRGDI